jgi:hypothetical protein
VATFLEDIKAKITQARDVARQRDFSTAIAIQQSAVSLARQRGQERDALVTLSVLLYNLAGYYLQIEQYADAVAALEEVVALDELTHHRDLENDRTALFDARQQAEIARIMHQATGQLAQMSPVERTQFQTAVERWTALPLAKREALQIRAVVDETRQAAIAALSGEMERASVAQLAENFAVQAAQDAAPGSPWDEAARFLQAVVALLQGAAPPPVPQAYAQEFADIQSASLPK